VSERTIAHYDRRPQAFWEGTRNHDVSQNYAALLDNIEGTPPYSILDLGCGPGRDLHYFRSLGHDAVGLDGAKEFAAMTLPDDRFDGMFANASLFHVLSLELPRVLRELGKALKARGVLFCSNPRGHNEEGFSNDRYSCFHDLETWRKYVTAAGFSEIAHYYRPTGLPRDRQPWLATVWRKG